MVSVQHTESLNISIHSPGYVIYLYYIKLTFVCCEHFLTPRQTGAKQPLLMLVRSPSLQNRVIAAYCLLGTVPRTFKLPNYAGELLGGVPVDINQNSSRDCSNNLTGQMIFFQCSDTFLSISYAIHT